MSRSESYRYSDNVNVLSNKDGAEYLAIFLADEEKWKGSDDKERVDPRSVTLTRYGVPGRCDVYRFALSQERLTPLTFFTEYGLTVGAAAAKCVRDLNKAHVVEMFRVAFDQKTETNFRFLQEMREVIRHIAPTSKTLKVLDKLWDTIRAQRGARWDERKKQRDALQAAGLPIPKELTHCRP